MPTKAQSDHNKAANLTNKEYLFLKAIIAKEQYNIKFKYSILNF